MLKYCALVYQIILINIHHLQSDFYEVTCELQSLSYRQFGQISWPDISHHIFPDRGGWHGPRQVVYAAAAVGGTTGSGYF